MAQESFLTSDTYTSQLFNSLYYAKKSLKALLQERSVILQRINIKPERGSFEDITNSVLLLFNEYPLDLEQSNFLVLRQAGIYFIFFSTDYKYIPLCKVCNKSVYVTVHNNNGKIICCNIKCKRMVLEEFQIKKKPNNLNLNSNKQSQHQKSVNSSKIKSSSVSESAQKPIQNKEDIIKTIQRIFK